MGDLLIEIGTEELPPSVIEPALNFLKDRLSKILGREDILTFGTPRRLSLYLRNFKDEKISAEEVVFGPPWKVAFDREGKPTKALMGFLKRYGADPRDVFKEKKGKGEYVALRLIKEEKSRLKELQESFENILLEVPFPKRMRWTSSKDITFSRPVRWLVALHGERILELSFGRLKAGNRTKGHRFLSKGWIEIPRAEQYLQLMEENYVLVDIQVRKETILRALEDEVRRLGASLEYPQGLLEEVTNLVEYPFVVVGNFDKKFLELPDRVIITVSAHHQRFFCLSKEGALINYFIGVSNNEPRTDSIRRGYERVLKARLEDALFFYREDLKKKLEDLVPELSGILIHPKIGTVLDKVERLKKLASRLCEELGYGEKLKKKLLRASHLSKADLLTDMVRELDELQGYMGYVYALKQGEDEEVAIAIEEQYKPKGPEDELPKTKIGALLSLADKIDDLLSFFKAGEIPKGSSDPYGLRRASFGMLRILDSYSWDINLRNFFAMYGLPEEVKPLEEFLSQRLESYLSEERYDLLRAVLNTEDPLRPLRVIRKVRELSKIKDSRKLTDIYEAYRRVAKILPRDWESTEVDEKLLKEGEEKALWDLLKNMEGREPSLSELAELRKPIDNLFDKVLIMDKDIKVRNNRLSLLRRLRNLFERYADFSQIVPQEV